MSYYALFKGWLLLSQPPGCLCILTSFVALSHDLRTLAVDLGCCPLDYGTFCRSLTAVITVMAFGVCKGSVSGQAPEDPNSALPP